MIRLIKHKDIDKKQWDNCIDNCMNALPYAYSWYLDLVTGNRWDAYIADEYKSVFPVPFHRKRFIKSVYQPFFTQQLGLFSTERNVVLNAQPYIDLLLKRYFRVYLHINSFNSVMTNIKMEYRITHQVRMNRSYADLYSAYSSIVKNNLQRFSKGQHEIIYSNQLDDIVDFTRQNIGEKVSELQPGDYIVLNRLLEKIIEHKKGFIVRVSDSQRNLLAQAFIIKSNNKLIYLMAASTKQGRKVNAMTALIDDIFKKYITSEFIFDFEGSMIPGIANFYKNFGAQEVKFPVIEK